jgi:hypothetical protein
MCAVPGTQPAVSREARTLAPLNSTLAGDSPRLPDFPYGELLSMDEFSFFYGDWRIKEMEMWDHDFIDAEVPGYFHFGDDYSGEFQFGYVHGYMNCWFSVKNGKSSVEFSWDGNDEMDPASGTATIEGDVLSGRLFFHEGDNSGVSAIRKKNSP